MDIKIIDTSGSEIVTLTEAKEWLRIDDDITDRDDLITSLIVSARQYFESKTNRSLMIHVAQRKFIDRYGSIDLYYDTNTIDSLNSYKDGTPTELTLDDYGYFDQFESKFNITTELPEADYYIIEFTTKQLNDEVVKMAMKRIIKDAYDESGDPAKRIRTATDRVISSYKRWRFK